jgi:Spy/CpxP family protein refolding chaperone
MGSFETVLACMRIPSRTQRPPATGFRRCSAHQSRVVSPPFNRNLNGDSTYMNLSRLFVTGCLTVGLLGCATSQKPCTPSPTQAPANPAPKTSAKPAPTTAATPKAQPARPVNEFEQMIALLNLQGDQLAKFNAARAERDAAVKAWEASAQGKKLADLRTELATAKAAKDQDKINKVTAQLEPISKAGQAQRSEHRAKVMAVLTLPQQQKWAGFVLANRLNKDLRRVKLTEDQKPKIQAACDKAAVKFVTADTVAKDPYLMTMDGIRPSVVKEISNSILTAEQRDRLAPPQTAPSK